MKIKSVIITFFSCLLLAMPLVAQAPQEVTLTVSSDGPTKEEATKNALRSAIEQAYGAFVSANTTILNDELVKDEIVTISNGSIKDYKEISAVQTDNGNHFVTLSATVSLPNLITYAKNHGSECEFAGNTFGMEMKLFELQKESELKALYNLTEQIEAILPVMMKHELIVGEPCIPKVGSGEAFRGLSYEHRICHRYNPDLAGTNGACFETVDSKAKAHIQQFLKENIESTSKNYYEIPMTINWVNATHKSKSDIATEVETIVADYESKLNKKDLKKFSSEKKVFSGFRLMGNRKFPYQESMTQREHMIDSLTKTLENRYNTGVSEILLSTLQSISVPRPQIKEFGDRGINLTTIYIQGSDPVCFRNSKEEVVKWIQDLFLRIRKKFNSFVIADNTGAKSDFFPQHIAEKLYIDFCHKPSRPKYGPNFIDDKAPVMMSNWDGEVCIFGTGLFYNYFWVSDPDHRLRYPKINDESITIMAIQDITQPRSADYGSFPFKWDLKVYIPKEDIGKYSKFWIEPRE